jgi:glucose uptake protein GlcU
LPPITYQQLTSNFFSCIALALVAGFFYGLTPVPVVYIEDNHGRFPNSPRTGISFMFSLFFGILLSSTIIFFVYVIWKRNRPQINPNIVLPSICGGIIWGLAMSGLIASIDIFGQTITYPITTTVPGESLWRILLET